MWDSISTSNYKNLGRKKSKDAMVQEDYALEDCEEFFTLQESPKKKHTIYWKK
jgi:hypothetical protein